MVTIRSSWHVHLGSVVPLGGKHNTGRLENENKAQCTVIGCPRGIKSAGLCGMHYKRRWDKRRREGA